VFAFYNLVHSVSDVADGDIVIKFLFHSVFLRKCGLDRGKLKLRRVRHLNCTVVMHAPGNKCS
jgi:hypothetical protein